MSRPEDERKKLNTITIFVQPAVKEKLVELAKDRKMSQQDFLEAIAEWVADQDVQTLARHGVRLPLWPDEIERLTRTG